MFICNLKKMDGNKKKIAVNVFWAMLGKIVSMAGTLLVGIFVARYLGPSQYGLMNYVISYVSLFTVLSSFGLDNIEIRELSRRPFEKERILGTCFGIRVLCSFFAMLLIVITLLVYKTDLFTTIMILCYSLTLFSGCFNIIRNYFTSIVKNEYIVKAEINRTLLGATLKIFLLFVNAPLEYFILASIFDTFLVAGGYILAYHRIIGKIKEWKFSMELIPYFVKESLPLLLSGAAIIVYQRIDQVMIRNMIDAESVGFFATAGKFLDLILFLPAVLTQTVTPMLVQKKRDGDKCLYEKKAFQFVSIIVWISIILALLTSLFSYWMISLTYGKEYLSAVPVLQIMAWKTVAMAISSSGGQLIIIENIQKWAAIRNVMGCIACVILNYMFIPTYGIVGSACVTVVTVLISGFFANAIIPPYRHIFKLEIKAVLLGWKELAYVKNFKKGAIS